MLKMSPYRQLPGLDSFRLSKPGKVDFLDQVGEGLSLELGAAQPFLGSHDEDLVVASTIGTDVATQLEKLANLLAQGILTDEEFQAQKQKLLSM